MPHSVSHIAAFRGVACLEFNVRTCGDMVNAFTNSVDPNETPYNAASHQDLRYLRC